MDGLLSWKDRPTTFAPQSRSARPRQGKRGDERSPRSVSRSARIVQDIGDTISRSSGDLLRHLFALGLLQPDTQRSTAKHRHARGHVIACTASEVTKGAVTSFHFL
ncbi:hypothetical protein L1887_56022 [Cichorium endivia]|nr:hypothetical protein L1887_56022 [Cichorium endivia]